MPGFYHFAILNTVYTYATVCDYSISVGYQTLPLVSMILSNTYLQDQDNMLIQSLPLLFNGSYLVYLKNS
jgi:hypothetical protein